MSASVTSAPSRTTRATHSVQPTRHVREREGLREAATGAFTGVRDQIRFEEFGNRLSPIGEGPRRDTPSNRRRGVRAVALTGRAPTSRKNKESVNGRRAGREQLHPDSPIKLQVAMSF